MSHKKYINTGLVVNTHGVKGEVKIQPWSDGPELFLAVSAFYIDGKPVRINSARIHKNMVLAFIDGVGDIPSALAYKGKILQADRDDIPLNPGQIFIEDIIGLEVFDRRTDRIIGRVADVLKPPANDVYVVKEGEKTHYIPVVAEFVESVDPDAGRITIRTIGGMLTDED